MDAVPKVLKLLESPEAACAGLFWGTVLDGEDTSRVADAWVDAQIRLLVTADLQ